MSANNHAASGGSTLLPPFKKSFGLSKIPLAKLLDMWGQPQGPLPFLSQAVSYILIVFIADTLTMKNCAIMLSFAISPYVITTWIGGPIAQFVLAGSGWRWAFGIFTIIISVVVVPPAALVLFNDRKARKQGLLEPRRIDWSAAAIKKFCVDVDAIGILVLVAGMALFLLPLSLYRYQADKWKSPMIIGMIVAGFVSLIAFPIWERFFASVTFILYKLLLGRTVFLAGVMFDCVYFNGAVWGSYFGSILQVVWNLNVTTASCVQSIYRVVSCFWCLAAVGLAIRITGRLKWVAVFFALPTDILALELMIHSRQPRTSMGYIVMTQSFTAVAGETIVIAGELAMMVPSDHQHMAVSIAVLNLFCFISSAVGSTVSATIWIVTFYKNLVKNVPAGFNVADIYASLQNQLSYEWGSPERTGIAQPCS
ncbi:hypothetical protein G6011_02767 [Alternaria panax]|uniref:Uncharacterized protein n=1 Tax=Alternaria panax TaxID=48097 RepID=A0AAD4FBF1_9PLEO|nr:hypothetical protein G6011_02767 [Alternaria panax]